MSQIKKSGLLKNVKSFDRQMAQLSVDFRLAVTDSLNIYAFGEGLPLEPGEPVLIPYASAQQLSRNDNYKVENATHLTICKPASKQAANYSLLKNCLVEIGQAVQTQTTPSLLQDKHVVSQAISWEQPHSEEASTSYSIPEFDLR
ncbi:unnamed protein product [Sphagnum balticum]